MAYLFEEDYKKIFTLMPVCCVDLVVVHKGKFLLVKRTMEPMKGEWWFPGGRIYKNERLNHGAQRKAKEELGIFVKILKNIGTYELFFQKGPFNLKDIHNIVICFLVTPVEKNPKIVLDETSSEYRWYDKIKKEWPDYIKSVIESIHLW